MKNLLTIWPPNAESQTPDETKQEASVDHCVKIHALVCGERAKSRLRARACVSKIHPLAIVSAIVPFIAMLK